MDGRTAALTALAVVLLIALAVAWRVDAEATTRPTGQTFALNVIDESGEPLVGATATSDTEEWVADDKGTIAIELTSPALLVVTADGMIPDAVVLGSPGTPHVTLQLRNRIGPGGERTVMHFGGDFMMGRRYQEPTSDRTPVAVDEESARAIVDDIAPLFALADLASVNFESVIGTLSPEDAYTAKRFLLQSPPEAIAALDELSVDVATLGNNHINDWMDAGVMSTIRHLDAAGIAYPGGGTTAGDALQPAIIETGAGRIGVISMTTVTGDYVNDSLPSATDPVPAAVSPEDRWQYESRSFGFGVPGDANHIPVSDRRPGAMWAEFEILEDTVSVGDAVDVWLGISRTYPELQDWVARRGHGGAAQFSRDAVGLSIEAARDAGADLVIVQLHGGLQFAEVSSEYFRAAARVAVDAGADLVIGHHPHVLQGFEYYDDTLIAHSLGNFVFDQDFLVTHPSVVLRTVFEGQELLEAKLYPVMIDNYRPVPVGGEVSDMILEVINVASLQEAGSIRLPDGRVGTTPVDTNPTAEIVKADGWGVVVPAGTAVAASLSLDADTPAKLDVSTVALAERLQGVRAGYDLFGFGNLEDLQADRRDRGGLEWVLPADSLEIDDTSPAGPWTVRLDRTSQHLEETLAGTAARVPMPGHRWFDESGLPVDGNSSYTIRVWAKRVGAGIPFVRVSFYSFDDTDPTRVPESTALEAIDIELPLVNDGEWHELWVDVPEPPAAANSALVGVGLSPPESRSGTVWVDGLQIVEWRPASTIPAGGWSNIDYLLAPDDRTVALLVRDTP